MRKRLLLALVPFLALFTLTTPSRAQEVPAPKVTITGTFDQITSMGRNFYDGNYTRTADHEWYARTRFRPDFEFAVGRTKAVLGIELDLNYGQTGSNDGGFPGNNSGQNCGFVGGCHFGTGGGLDINTDVAGLFEIKWIYTEFDLTGKDSLLPFIPVLTVARAGGQPFGTIANYKIYYANGDFAGLDLYTRFTPDIKNHLAWVDVEDQLANGNLGANTQIRTNRGKDFAIIESPEFTPFKGLDLKPMFSWFHADGVTTNAARRDATNRRTSGGSMNSAGAFAGIPLGTAPAAAACFGCTAPGDPSMHEERYTVGFDARWRVGGFGLDPTIAYQWGNYDTQATRTNGTVGKVRGDASAWLVDVIASYQLGPLLLEARAIYSTGNKARDNLSLSKRYYEPLDLDGSYNSGWGAILVGTGVDYFNGGGGPSQSMATNVGYDRFGRASLGLRATYSLTPALAFYGIASPTWTAEKVDTDTTVALAPQQTYTKRATVDDKSWVEGDSRYLGTELDLGLTWRFAPNTAFDLQGGYLFTGAGLNTAELLNGVHTRRDARDAYTLAARVRLAF
jgi:hypothetical protein